MPGEDKQEENFHMVQISSFNNKMLDVVVNHMLQEDSLEHDEGATERIHAYWKLFSMQVV